MSPLPEKRKSAEEIAELRRSLGISEDGPPAGAPGMGGLPETADEGEGVNPEAPPEPVPVRDSGIPLARPKEDRPEPESVPERPTPTSDVVRVKAPLPVDSGGTPAVEPASAPAGEVPKLRSPHSLRKSESLVVDQPKKAVARDTGKLPVRRHTEKELMQLRKERLTSSELHPAHLGQLKAHPVLLVLFYGAGVLGAGLAVLGVWATRVPVLDLPFDWLAAAVAEPGYERALHGILAGGGLVMLLGAGWIHWKRKYSRHHAAMLTFLAVLVLVFGTLYFFPELHGA